MKRPRSFHFIPAKKKRKLFISLFPIDARDINSEEKIQKDETRRLEDFFSSKMIPEFQRFSSFQRLLSIHYR